MQVRALLIDMRSTEARSAVAETLAGCCELRVVDSHHALLQGMDQEVDLIVCTLDFPDIDSLAFLKSLRHQYPRLPLVMVTQAHSEELAVWALRVRLWDYFVDPVDPEQLRAIIEVLANRDNDPQRLFSRESPNASLPQDYRYQNKNSQKSLILPALNYVAENLHQKVTEAEAAKLCAMSTFQFSRHFKKCLGLTFKDYLIQARIEKASHLLENPNALVTDVAYQVGFRDHSNFSRTFKKVKGVAPSSYRGLEGRLVP